MANIKLDPDVKKQRRITMLSPHQQRFICKQDRAGVFTRGLEALMLRAGYKFPKRRRAKD